LEDACGRTVYVFCKAVFLSLLHRKKSSGTDDLFRSFLAFLNAFLMCKELPWTVIEQTGAAIFMKQSV
jgi:hypothetical protein